ncbi:MAG: nucleotidyltransferase domain-containing protein [Aquiluna sp.]|jgi:hypothetical protein
MIINRPHAGLLSDSMAAVLRTLALSNLGRSGRAIASECPGVSVAQVNNMIRRLEQLGIVRSESIPPAKRYFLNREHILVEPLLAIATGKEGAIKLVEQLFSGFPGLDSVILFGSVARGDDTAESDVDVLLLFDYDTEDQIDHAALSELCHQYWNRTGNELNYIANIVSEATPNLIASSGFLQNVLNEGQVIMGRGLSETHERFPNESPNPTVNSHGG